MFLLFCSIVIFILSKQIYSLLLSSEIHHDNFDEEIIPVQKVNGKYFDNHETIHSNEVTYDNNIINYDNQRNSKDNQIDDQSSLLSNKRYDDMNVRYENKYHNSESYSSKNTPRYHDKEYDIKDQTTTSFTNRNEYSNQNRYHNEETYDTKNLSPRRYSDNDYHRNDHSIRYGSNNFKIYKRYPEDLNQYERNYNKEISPNDNRYYSTDINSHKSNKNNDINDLRKKLFRDSIGKISDSSKYKSNDIDDTIERSNTRTNEKGVVRFYRDDSTSQNLRRKEFGDVDKSKSNLNYYQRTKPIIDTDDGGDRSHQRFPPDSYRINLLHQQKLINHLKSVMKNNSENIRFNQLKDKIFKYREKFNTNETLFIKNELYNLTTLGVHSYLLTNKTYFNNSSYFNMSTITKVSNKIETTNYNTSILKAYRSIITHENSTTNHYHINNSNNNNSTFMKMEDETLIKLYRNEYAKIYVTLKAFVERIIYHARYNHRNNDKNYIENYIKYKSNKDNQLQYHRKSYYNTNNKYSDRD